MPILADGGAALIYGIFAVMAIREARDDHASVSARTEARARALITVPMGLATAASGVWGVRVRGDCRAARDAHERWLDLIVPSAATRAEVRP